MLTRVKSREGFVARCSLPVPLAHEIEECLFVYCAPSHASTHKKYQQKCRSLQFNLSRNAELRARLMQGEISAPDIVRLDAPALATTQTQQHRDSECTTGGGGGGVYARVLCVYVCRDVVDLLCGVPRVGVCHGVLAVWCGVV